MDLDWEKLVKRYVWHDERTPYFTRVARLTRRQAHYEIFAYALFMGVLFGVISIATLPTWISLYAFSVCCAAILLGTTRHPAAALWCALAPLAALGYFALYGFHPSLALADKVLLTVVVLAGLLYSPRVVAVARAA
jgi:SNF family Na+-dependent transporter